MFQQTRRVFLIAASSSIAVCISSRVLAQLAAARYPPALSRTIARVPIPDSAVARAAVGLGWTAYPTFLFNHCLRTYLFGAMLAEQDAVSYDAEMIFIAATLHDLGLTRIYASPEHPFEMDGADAAKAFLTERGVRSERAELVWNAIALHASILVEHQDPQVGIVGNGAGADVFGVGIPSLPGERVAEVLAAFPRLSFNTEFRTLLVEQCHRKPLSQRATWLDSFCRAHNPGVAYPDLEKRLLEGWAEPDGGKALGRSD